MKTITTNPKIISNIENIKYNRNDDGTMIIFANEYNISIESARLLWFMLDLKSAVDKDLKDIWERLDELEKKINKI